MDFSQPEEPSEIRAAVRELCSRAPSEARREPLSARRTTGAAVSRARKRQRGRLGSVLATADLEENGERGSDIEPDAAGGGDPVAHRRLHGT